jgi:integrase/recombinase XerC
MLNPGMIDQFLANLTINGASHETIRAYRADLMGALLEVGSPTTWADTEHQLATYLTDHRAALAPKTTARRLTTFRSYARCHGQRDFLANYRAPKAATAEPHPIPEGIDGVLRMIQSSRNPRHRALCALTGLMGLRISEAIAVHRDDFDIAEMVLTVRGKGDKTRIVPVSDKAWRYIKTAHAKAGDGSIVKLGNRGARYAISRHARNAGLSRHVASHDMRATLATAAYDKTRDLRAVQELLGHADPRTTQVYTRVSMTARRTAIEVA